jgi:hypothetical protein
MALTIPLTSRLSAPAPALVGVPTPAGEAPASGWIEASDGQLPIVISIPHGGEAKPSEIPDRQNAVLLNDPGSLQFGRELVQALAERTGRQPYLVINHLARSKLDPNRSLSLGAQGDPGAVAAWRAYHDAIQRAAGFASQPCGWAVYFDLHSNGRPDPRVEFGYGLTVDDLDRTDEALADRQYAVRSNLRTLATFGRLDFPDLVRGEGSLGGLIEAHGYSVAPSPDNPVPQADYFDGGLSVVLHGSRYGGSVDAVQIEAPYSLLDDSRRQFFVGVLAEAIIEWMDQSHGFSLAGPGAICSGFADVALDDPGGAAVAALNQVSPLPACQANPRRLCPSEPITRGEAAQMVWQLVRTSIGPAAVNVGPAFTDLPNSPDQREAVRALSQRGLLRACELAVTRFCPTQAETRGEAALLGMRLLKGSTYLPPLPAGIFADGPTRQWSTWWLEAAYGEGLLAPCRMGAAPRICGDEPISRRDFAALVAAAVGQRGP